MQRTFLRSDSEDLLRLQQYFQTSIARSLRNDIQTTRIVDKLLNELERLNRECHQLSERNKQLEENLRKTNTELSTYKKKVERLSAAKVLTKSTQGSTTQKHLEQHKKTHYTETHQIQQKHINNITKREPQYMLHLAETTDNNCVNTSSNRKRCANIQISTDNGENDDIFVTKAPKRTLLQNLSERKSLENIAEDSPSNDIIVQKDEQQFYTANESLDTNGFSRKSRRSLSMPPVEKTYVVPAKITTATFGKPRDSRLLTLRNSRISSSHGDLSKVVIREQSPPFIDNENNHLLTTDEYSTHSFQTKRNFLRIQCGRCEFAIRFGILYVKCNRCKATFHEACRMQARLPCVVRKLTPKPLSIRYRLRLGDYCADNYRPMVPPLITYCTFHLDSCTNLPFSNIYCVDGEYQEVDAINKLFQSNKTFPKLENFKPVNIADCIKKFLNQIREPLIPFTYGKEIIGILASPEKAVNLAANMEDLLPPAHSDTLGHLCRHWKRLVANSNGILTIPLLGSYVGPIVFGSLRTDSSIPNDAVINAMQALLQLPNEFWLNMSKSPGTSRSHTPLSRNPSQKSNNQTPLGVGTSKIGSSVRLRHNTREINFDVINDKNDASNG